MYNVNSISSFFSNTGSAGAYDYRKELAKKIDNQTTSQHSESSQSNNNSKDSEVKLSSRAQKIQKLNEDFFPGGYQTIKITPEFIERLEEYGFISSQEAEKLTPKIKNDSSNQESVNLGDLSDFIDQFKSKLEQDDPHNSLITTLQKADHIINHFDSRTMQAEIKSVISELKKYSSSEQAEHLSQEDKDSFSQLEATMHVADKLSMERNASSKINSYLSVFNQRYGY